jgi:hypothetical protein
MKPFFYTNIGEFGMDPFSEINSVTVIFGRCQNHLGVRDIPGVDIDPSFSMPGILLLDIIGEMFDRREGFKRDHL